jgi:hypothetical protein
MYHNWVTVSRFISHVRCVSKAPLRSYGLYNTVRLSGLCTAVLGTSGEGGDSHSGWQRPIWCYETSLLDYGWRWSSASRLLVVYIPTYYIIHVNKTKQNRIIQYYTHIPMVPANDPPDSLGWFTEKSTKKKGHGLCQYLWILMDLMGCSGKSSLHPMHILIIYYCLIYNIIIIYTSFIHIIILL